MADVTVKRLEEFEAVFGGGMRRVRAGLGVTSFGMQVMELPPDFLIYPTHDHSHDEQEEVYLTLGGRAKLKVGEEEFDLEPGVFARVGPGQQRKLLTGEEGARILVLGATPGKVYEAPEWTEEGGALPPMPSKEEAHSA
jgi:mannose-6-phosphate isomerase-like protein (cupin superfamily)